MRAYATKELAMQVVHYTDPACPFAFSAEPQRLQLEWHYGDQLEWRTVLVGLAEDGETYVAKGLTPDKLTAGYQLLHDRYGMPIDLTERSRMAGTWRACRAVVATRLHDPAKEPAILRRLRVRTMGGELLDADATIAGAASDVGIDPGELEAWIAEDATEAAFREDMRAARNPLPAALVLDHKLAPSEDGGRRYTCPSYELHAGELTEAAPGFQPWETYDVTVANLDPTLERRAAPQDVGEVLDWARMPLATAEVAALVGSSIDEARTKLSEAGASFEPVGEDGYWTR
jgi:predicted DsbA family dithiol-disulfide isomerase